ncbi:glycoside hydrolase family 68 protein [Gemmatimonas sp.]|uniref:glycoside hydrolase family 68 protein n=1 Tax=Gemmatimonas sp. TaxID=1962908 RepID=UPI003340E091
MQFHRSIMGLALAGCWLTACENNDSPLAPDASGDVNTAYETTLWTAAQVQSMQLAPETSVPVITELPRPKTMPGYWIWDTWPVLTRGNLPARINGYYMIVSLTAPDSILPGKRHDIATYRYSISKDGKNWRDMGNLFDNGAAIGSRQWAGSTIYDEGTRKLTVFYTATGEKGETRRSYTQRMAMSSATLASVTDTTVRFNQWAAHKIILTPDLKYYAQSTGTDTKGIVFAFRDPSYFRDPLTGRSYITFTGRMHAAADQTYNGNAGLAIAKNDDLTEWELMKPIIAAPDVNAELERPIMTVLDNRYYLVISTHLFTFKPPLKGPEGMYSWTATSMFGPWTPMNGSALMLHNPATNPDQTYSYQMLQDRSVLSFINFIGPGESCGYYVGCADASAADQATRFGGTLTKSVLMSIQGTTARVIGQRDDQITP